MTYTQLTASETQAEAFRLLEAKRFALVMTVGLAGQAPKARVMTPTVQQGAIWFRTRLNSAKVPQLRKRHAAEVVTATDGFAQFAKFQGTVSLIGADDLDRAGDVPARMATTFEEELNEERVLLKFVPVRIHYTDHLSNRRGIARLALDDAME